MAANFDKYLDVPVESIERPKAPPIGHFIAAVKSWKTSERTFKKEDGPKPLVTITFVLNAALDDVDEDELVAADVKFGATIVQRDYELGDAIAMSNLRDLGEKAAGVDVKGLKLSDMLNSCIGMEVKLYHDHRQGTGENEDVTYSKVGKIMAA